MTRINHFEAKPGREARLREQFAVIEVWDSIEARRLASKALTPEQLRDAMPLLSGLPTAVSFLPVKHP